MIIAAIFLALLIVGAVYMSHKIAYQVGYEAGDAARDCKATKECEAWLNAPAKDEEDE
jgi:hypothetical protein